MELNPATTQAKAALIRVGQTGEVGCLSIIDGSETVLVFTGQGLILNIYKDGVELPDLDLEEVFSCASSHLWLADAKPPKIGMGMDISSVFSRRAHRPTAKNVKTAKLVGLSHAASAKPKKKVPAFYLIADVEPRKKFPLERPTIVIGRDKGCDIVIADRSISRRHCILQMMVRGLFVRDLASSNGVFINGTFAREGFLINGDKLTLGGRTFEVHVETKTAHLPRLH